MKRPTRILLIVLAGGLIGWRAYATYPRPFDANAHANMFAEDDLIGAQVQCLPNLSHEQIHYVFDVSRYAAQHYLLTMTQTGEEADCQMRALHACEARNPGRCVALAGEER